MAKQVGFIRVHSQPNCLKLINVIIYSSQKENNWSFKIKFIYSIVLCFEITSFSHLSCWAKLSMVKFQFSSDFYLPFGIACFWLCCSFSLCLRRSLSVSGSNKKYLSTNMPRSVRLWPGSLIFVEGTSLTTWWLLVQLLPAKL